MIGAPNTRRQKYLVGLTKGALGTSVSGEIFFAIIYAIRALISNHIQCVPWNVIIHPFTNINGGFAKSPLKLAYEWVLMSTYILLYYMVVITYDWPNPDIISVNLC